MITSIDTLNNIRLLRKDEAMPYNLLLLADEVVEVIDKYIHDCDIYVLESNGEMIGVYTLLTIDQTSIEIKDLAVQEERQGKGLGKALLSHAFQVAALKGFQTILIGTGDACIYQLYLYQKVGFEMCEIWNNFYIDNYPYPVFENGIQLRHMVRLKRKLIS